LFRTELRFARVRLNFTRGSLRIHFLSVLRQASEVAIDTSVPSQRFTTDCEACCRPFEVIPERAPVEISNSGAVGN